MPKSLPAALSDNPAGQRAVWVVERLAAVASGGPIPSRVELENQYAEAWLSEVPMAVIFSEVAPLVAEGLMM